MRRLAFLILLIFLASPLGVSAQADGDAKVGGQVVDSSGVPLAGVEVSLKGLHVGGVYRMTTTDDNGSYTIDRLEPAWYWVEGSLKGYGRHKVRLRIDPGSRTRHDITLLDLEEFASKVEESRMAGFGLKEGLVLASQALEKGDLDGAGAILDQIRDLGRWDADYQELDGRHKAGLDQCDPASEAFARGAKIRRGKVGFRARADWAACLERRGDMEDAMALWQDVLAVQPYLWEARVALAGLYWHQGEAGKALGVLQEKDGSMHSSALPEAHALRASLVMGMGDPSRALDLLEDAIEHPRATADQKVQWQAQLESWQKTVAQSPAAVKSPASP